MLDHYSIDHQNNFLGQLESDRLIEFQIHFNPEIFNHDAESHSLLETHSERKFLSHEEYEKLYGLSADTVEQVEKLAGLHGLKILTIDKAKRLAILEGTTEQINNTFLIQMGYFENHDPDAKQHAIGYAGSPQLEAPLADKVASIEGLSTHDKKEKRVRNIQNLQAMPASPTRKVGYWPSLVGDAYQFPDADGKGQCLGIVELGGTFKQADIDGYFKDLGIPSPEIVVVGNQPKSNPQSYSEDIEVTSDIQVAGALVPKAKIVLYYGNTILEAMKLAISDTKNSPSVLSISWAASEFQYSNAQLSALAQASYEAALKGITVLGASGDHGAYNVGLAPKGMNMPNVNIPASLTYVLGCGGTTLQLSNETISSEVVWNEAIGTMHAGTGGGFSNKFGRPPFQVEATSHYFKYYPSLNNTARGVPDVGASASNATGYTVLFNGVWMKVGGTSLSTPLWAALISRLNQLLGHRLGFFNQTLYRLAGTSAFRSIVQGNNGYYNALTYWNPCTGLGSPSGKEILEFLKN